MFFYKLVSDFKAIQKYMKHIEFLESFEITWPY